MNQGLFLFLCRFFIFVFGLAVGSFLNALIFRLKSKENVVLSRSHCDHCGQKLGWQDLIPLLSFLWLKAKCRHCGNRISWQYPLVELATGFLFVLAALPSFFDPWFFVFALLIISLLVVIFVFDLKHYLIPDQIVYSGMFVSLVWQLFRGNVLNSLLAGLGASLFFLAIVLFSEEKWMGWGDVKMALFMGLLLGFPNVLVALFLSFFLGSLVGISLIVAKRKGLKSEIPFGPFLSLATLITLFWAKEIINWYLKLTGFG
jgi:leader peptidase (prepilin peptidase)/N-methyltransferase